MREIPVVSGLPEVTFVLPGNKGITQGFGESFGLPWGVGVGTHFRKSSLYKGAASSIIRQQNHGSIALEYICNRV
jgi:hypothetical protein